MVVLATGTPLSVVVLIGVLPVASTLLTFWLTQRNTRRATDRQWQHDDSIWRRDRRAAAYVTVLKQSSESPTTQEELQVWYDSLTEVKLFGSEQAKELALRMADILSATPYDQEAANRAYEELFAQFRIELGTERV